MVIGITVICCMLLFCLLVGTVYFSKSKLKNTENKLYSRLVIITMIGLVLELLCFFFVAHKDVSSTYNILNEIINRAFLVYLLLWEFLFTEYMFFISFESSSKFKERLKKSKKSIIGALTIIYIIMAIIVIKLPLYYFNDGNYIYSYGMATNVLLLMGGIFIIIDIFSVCSNIKHITDKKYYPLFMLILMMIFVFVIRQINPGITIINSAFAFVTVLMYFTIENPDLKMVNELLRNRELLEDQIEDKSRFLFETSQEIKAPTKNIIGITKAFDKLDNDIDKKDAVRIIGDNANGILFRLNNILDISSLDANKIKVNEDYYNTSVFFNEIKGLTQNAIKDKNIALNFKVSSNVPNSLNGDNVKFKQVLMSVILNCIENTKKGYIRIYIDAIVRYDVARIIINIEDTGIGMDIEKINDILDDKSELNESDTSKLDKLDVDLKVSIKIIKLLGGSFNIKSEEDKGTTFTIVIDQKCKIEELTDIMKDIGKYSSDVYGRKRVLVVDDNKEELFTISNILGKYNIDINTTMSGKDCIDRLKAGEFYNLIIIDDELKGTSALATLEKLKENKKFKVPVVVMLEKDKEHFKKYYLDDGFSDIVLKEDITDEIERVIAKLL